MSMGDEVGYGAGIAPHPNGEREKTSAIFNIEHNRSPAPLGRGLGEGASAHIPSHHATPISIPSNPTSNPDGSAFSISHASNWWLIWVRITCGERIT